MQLDLACMCHATSFIHNGSWLVIDIHDGASPPDTQLATGEAGPAPGSAALPADDTLPAALPAVLPRTPPGAAPTDAGDLLARAARVADAQAAVLEEISRAASQGLLQGTPICRPRGHVRTLRSARMPAPREPHPMPIPWPRGSGFWPTPPSIRIRHRAGPTRRRAARRATSSTLPNGAIRTRSRFRSARGGAR
ncbi:MAG: hypothetical protein JKP98_24470 [Rhodobacteraceae bacterium]|nr:hypothetical protein [Paracoccaceae bacterium]